MLAAARETTLLPNSVRQQKKTSTRCAANAPASRSSAKTLVLNRDYCRGSLCSPPVGSDFFLGRTGPQTPVFHEKPIFNFGTTKIRIRNTQTRMPINLRTSCIPSITSLSIAEQPRNNWFSKRQRALFPGETLKLSQGPNECKSTALPGKNKPGNAIGWIIIHKPYLGPLPTERRRNRQLPAPVLLGRGESRSGFGVEVRRPLDEKAAPAGLNRISS